MIYFGNRRPRGFHYTYRFHNEQRELLDNLRRGIAPDILAERSLNGDAPDCDAATSRRSHRHNASTLSIRLSVMVILLLLVLCLMLIALL